MYCKGSIPSCNGLRSCSEGLRRAGVLPKCCDPPCVDEEHREDTDRFGLEAAWSGAAESSVTSQPLPAKAVPKCLPPAPFSAGVSIYGELQKPVLCQSRCCSRLPDQAVSEAQAMFGGPLL